jgi:chitinase
MRPLAALLLFGSILPLEAGGKRLISYYPYWAATQTPPYTAANIPFGKMTHIMHAFLLANTKGDGTIVIPPGLIEPALISGAHAAGVKVSISVGGADGGQDQAFRSIAGSSTYRQNFAHNIRDFLVKYGYDGVDIDWEVPQSAADVANCTLLMRALRAELPSPFLISMAVTSNPPNYGNYNLNALTPIVDFFNVMTYDFHGPWTNHTGHNSPLFLSPDDPGQEGSLKTSIDLYHVTHGVPADKLNMGTAFYGYQFKKAGALWASCGCGAGTFSVNYGTYIKQRINLKGWQSHYDAIAEEPYLLKASGADGFITYDDAESTTRKVKYVLGTRGMGGVFMWDLSADYDGTSQDLLDAMWQAVQ